MPINIDGHRKNVKRMEKCSNDVKNQTGQATTLSNKAIPVGYIQIDTCDLVKGVAMQAKRAIGHRTVKDILNYRDVCMLPRTRWPATITGRPSAW